MASVLSPLVRSGVARPVSLSAVALSTSSTDRHTAAFQNVRFHAILQSPCKEQGRWPTHGATLGMLAGAAAAAVALCASKHGKSCHCSQLDPADDKVYSLTQKSLGNYQQSVEHLRKWMGMYHGVRSPQKIVSVGHGGRDTWLTWALIEAASAAGVQDDVQFNILSSVWSDDGKLMAENWTAAMEEYVKVCKFKNVQLERMTWEDPIQKRVKQMQDSFKSASAVLQCEQGVDYFVLPDRGGLHPVLDCFLQDNFEDWISFIIGIRHSQANNIPMLVIQTNADLDMGKGIGSTRINKLIFDGKFQEGGCFDRPMDLPRKQQSSMIQCALKLGRPDGKTLEEQLINRRERLAVLNKSVRDRFDSFVQTLQSRRDAKASQQSVTPASDFYTDFGLFVAAFCDAKKKNIIVPAAVFLELVAATEATKGDAPQPQWLVAEHRPGSQLQSSLESMMVGFDIDKATAAEWLYCLMKVRRVTDKHKELFRQQSERQALRDDAAYYKFVQPRLCDAKSKNLAIAANVATHVLQECEDFSLWKDPKFLLRVLQKLEGERASDGVSILSSLTGIYPHHRESLQIMEFLCLMLGFGQVDQVAQFILESHLQRKALPENVQVPEHFNLFKDMLVKEWQLSQSSWWTRLQNLFVSPAPCVVRHEL